MASIIRIKRSTGILAPSSLKTAELAYAYGVGTQANKGDRLFIGTGDNGAGGATAITVIGGSYFTDMLDHVAGTLTASSAIVVDSDKKVDQLLSGDIVIDGATNSITTPGKILYSNVYDSSGALPSASTYHGMFAHVHGTGKGYYAHAGNWVELANKDSINSIDSSFTSFETNIDNTIDSHLSSTVDVIVGTYGSQTAIPILRVDSGGRIDSIGTAPLSTTFNITADSGTGDSVNMLDSVLNFSGSTGIITKVTDNNIDIRLDSTGISHSSANFHTDGNRKYGTGSGLEIAVDDFGRISHVVNTTINAELRVRDDPSNPFKSLFLGGQNDLIIKEGPGVKVTLTGPTHGGGGADYTPGTFEIAVDSGGTVTAEIVQADSGTYGTLRADSARFDAIYSRTGQNMTIAPNTDSGGTITIGTRYGNAGGAANNHALDLTNIGLKAGLIKGEAVGTTSLGSWAIPLQSTNLYNDLGFFGGQSHINIRDNKDSALTITAMTSLGAATADMVTYDTLDSEIEYHVNQRVNKDKFIYFGDDTTSSSGLIGRESTDEWLLIHNGGTGIALTSSNIELSSQANAGFKAIRFKGSLKTKYQPGELFDIGDSLGLLPAQPYSTWRNAYFSDTVFADSFQRTGISVDSGTYGSATTIPVFTVNQAGMIDSVGSVASSGIDSASWHPATNTLKITTDAETVHSVQIDDFDTDINIAIDKYINFGTGGSIRKESVDQHLQVVNNGSVSIIGTGIDLLSTSNDPFKTISIRGHLRPTYFPAAGGFDIGESADWTFRNAFFSGNVTSRTDAVDSNHLVLKRQVDSDITSVTLDSASWDKDTHNLNITIGGNVTQVTINEFDNVKIDGNTISSTDSSNRLFIDPFPVGDSGDLVIRGNLIVQGTETIVNSSVVSLNDKNLVLADSAANSGIADGAGITIGGAQYTGTKPQFVFDAATDRWDPNLPFDIPFASLDSAIFFNGVALREVVEDHLDNFFGVDSNAALSLTYNDVANSMTWKAINATKSQVGVSSFDSSNFSVTAGHVAVTVLDGGTY